MARRRRDTRMPAPFLRRIYCLEGAVDPARGYPFDLPWLQAGAFELELTAPVTVIVGENGSGKSTLIEAIAALAGYDEAGGGKGYRPAALGHPRVFLEIDEHGYVDCGYCDRRFILRGGPADGAAQAGLPDIASGADAGHP